MNKQNIIKQYVQEKELNLALVKDVQTLKIIQKASEFNVALFKNVVLAVGLLDMENIQELPKKHLKVIAEMFDFLVKTERDAQVSK